MALKFRRGTTAQQSGSLAFGEPYVNTTLGTLVVGGQSGDIVLSTSGTGSTGNFGAISGSGLDITGNANIAGNVTVGGKLTIGDATSDTVNVVASLSSSLIPSDNDTFDLGSPTKIWRDLYISTGSIKMYDRNGNLISTLSATADGMKITGELSASTISGLGSPSEFSSSVVSKFNTLGTYTGSVDTRLTEIGVVSGSLITSASTAKTTNDAQDVSISNINSFTSSINTTIKSKLDTDGVISGSSQITLSSTTGFTSYSSSVDSRITTEKGRVDAILSAADADKDSFAEIVTLINSVDLANDTAFASFYTASVGRLNNLESTSASVNISVSNLNTYTGSNDTTNTTQNTRLTALEASASTALSTNNTQATSITNLNSTTASLLIETANLETFSGSTLTRLTALESSASTALSTNNTQATSITNLNSTTASLNTSVTNINSFTASMGTTSNVRFGSLGIGMAASGTSGRIDAANDVVAFSTSDVRLKENIVPIPNAIEKIRKISGNTYDWKAELKDVHGYEGNDVGVIAQEVEEVLPQLVQDRDNGYKAVKYDKLVALLIEGIKEQQQHIDNLTIQVEELKKQKGL